MIMSLGKSINSDQTEKLFCLQFYYNLGYNYIEEDVDNMVGEILINPMSFEDIGNALSDASWLNNLIKK